MFSTSRRSILASVVTVLALFFSYAFAATPSRNEVNRVATNWLRVVLERDGNWGGVKNPTIGGIKEYKRGSDTLGYVVSIAPSGYIVISTSKHFSPIKAYSTTNNLDPQDDHGMSALLGDVLARRRQLLTRRFGSIESAEQQLAHVKTLENNRAVWSALLTEGDFAPASLRALAQPGSGIAGPLLDTRWHQSSPYNVRNPSGNNCSHTLVGCVATAMAQVMRYYCWPPHGNNSHSYNWDGDESCGGTTSGANLYADFSDDYDWVNMPESGASTTTQMDAVSELCYEAAVAVEMHFGCCSSGAYFYSPNHDDAQYALEHYFEYNTAGNRPALEDRDDYSYLDWWDLIRNEIDHNRPMIYKIEGSSGDFHHVIVADGYDNRTTIFQVHANYGWSDAHAAWYTLDLFDCDTAAGWQGGCDPDQEQLLRFIYPTNGKIGSTSGTFPSGSYSYIYGNATSSNLSAQAGAWIQFLGGTSGTTVTCTADSIYFAGSASEDTRLFSRGDSKRGIIIEGGHLTIRQYGGINIR
jgi:hypothetical protein